MRRKLFSTGLYGWTYPELHTPDNYCRPLNYAQEKQSVDASPRASSQDNSHFAMPETEGKDGSTVPLKCKTLNDFPQAP